MTPELELAGNLEDEGLETVDSRRAAAAEVRNLGRHPGMSCISPPPAGKARTQKHSEALVRVSSKSLVFNPSSFYGS